jgi:hypothetical protein
MTTAALCPRCRNPLLADAPDGLCPVCLLRDALPEHAAPDRGRVEALLARRLPQYRLVELAGRGGMGEVWVIEHTALGRRAALKLLASAVAAEPGFAARFLREAKAMADLAHPHIVTLYDFGECDGEYFLVMEYAVKNLRRLLETGGHRHRYRGDILGSFLPLCDALERVHESGMVHRDLKPENLLWVDGKLKLADFGLVHARGSGSPAASVVGTPDYMAPEQWQTPERVGQRADLYALGLIFYEMLTGQLPRGAYPAPSGDRRLNDVVARTLAPDPDRRYQSAAQLRADLEAIRARPVGVALWSDVGWLGAAATVLVLACAAVFGSGKSVACHSLLTGVIFLVRRQWYFPWGPRVALGVGGSACLVLDLVGPLFGLPPLVAPFPYWDPAGWVFTFVEMVSILLQTMLLAIALGALHQRLYPQQWVEWRQVDGPLGPFQPSLPFRATLVLVALLVLGVGYLAVVGYWTEALWPVWRWLPFTFAAVLVPATWERESRRPPPPVPPVVETPPLA